jgi:hypothetical protein
MNNIEGKVYIILMYDEIEMTEVIVSLMLTPLKL